jgi:hypothetical protein
VAVYWEPRDDQPDVPHISFAAIRNGLIGGVISWSLIIGLGWLGWQVGQSSWL